MQTSVFGTAEFHFQLSFRGHFKKMNKSSNNDNKTAQAYEIVGYVGCKWKGGKYCVQKRRRSI